MKYKVQWDYTSNIGSFDKGAVVEVDDALAEHVNRDSPGVLKPAKEQKAEKAQGRQTPKVNDGTVGDLLDKVGEDAKLAAEVIEAEKAEKNPRTSLIEGLEAVMKSAAETAADNGGD